MKRGPTPDQLEAARDKRLPDVIADDLQLVFVGINPSLYSAATGHHFGRPGNRFWPAMHLSGITDSQLTPAEQGKLISLGCGLTNIASRPTARADDLSADELMEGLAILQRKVRRRRIRNLAFLGVTAYRLATGQPRARLGKQPDTLGNATVYVLPNPSGLNAHYQLQQFAELFRDLGREVGLEGAS